MKRPGGRKPTAPPGDGIFKTLFENSFGSNAIFQKDAAGIWRFGLVNARLAGFLRQPTEKLAGAALADVLGEAAYTSGLAAALDQAECTGETVEFSGSAASLNWDFQARVVPLGAGRAGFAGMDTAPRKRLAEEQRTLETLAENIPVGVAVADAQAGVLRMISRYGLEEAGLEIPTTNTMALEAIPRYWPLYNPQTGQQLSLEQIPIIRSLRQGEVIRNEELLAELADGRKINVLVQSVPTRTDGGEISGAVAVWQDITEKTSHQVEMSRLFSELALEKKKTQQQADLARQQAEQLETVINSITDAVLIFRHGRLERINPAAIRAYGGDITGIPLQDLRGLLALRDLEDVPLAPGRLPSERAARGELVAGFWMRFTDLQKREHLALATAAPLYRDGVVEGAVAVWHDMTEHEELQQVLAMERSRMQLVLDHAPPPLPWWRWTAASPSSTRK